MAPADRRPDALRCVRRAALLALVLFAVPVAGAQATITVSNNNDAGAGSLRQAIVDAVTGETIVLPPDTYTLTSGELAIAKSVTIAGHGAADTIVRAGGAFRVLHTSGAGNTITVSNLTIRDGHVVSSIARGGGVWNESAQLALNDVVVTNNKADSDGVAGGTPASIAFGGGIASDAGSLALRRSQVTSNIASASGAAGDPAINGGVGGSGSIAEGGGLMSAAAVTIVDTTFADNASNATGGRGAGAANGGPGSIAFAGGAQIATGVQPASISSSTFASNSTDASGGAAGPTGGVAGPGGTSQGGGLQLTTTGGVIPFTNVTVTLNVARTSSTGSASGGGMQTSGSGTGRVVLANDTITANAASGPAAATGGNLQLNVGVDLRNTILSAGAAMAGKENCSAAGTSLGHNIEDTTPSQCGLSSPLGDQFGTNPLLGSLAANGGLTQTIAPLAISPAIDALQGNGCPATDQRGITRPQGAACDVGAYETAPGAAVTGQASAVTATSATLDGSATNPDALAGTGAFEYGLTAAYGLSSAAQAVAAGTTAGPFAAGIGGLAPATTYHFRAVASNGAGAAFGADQTFVTATAPPVTKPPTVIPPPPPAATPVLTGLSFSPTAFRAAASASSKAKKGVGSTVKYKLSMVAKVKFFVERPTKGRRVGSTCAKATKSNAKRKSCTRYVTLAGSLTSQGKTTPNTLRFTGRFGGHKLKTGKYRLRAVATTVAGKSSVAKRAGFRIRR
jgi:hypothetical protein